MIMQIKQSGVLICGRELPLPYKEDPQGRGHAKEFQASTGKVYQIEDLQELTSDQVLIAVYNRLWLTREGV